MAVQLDPDSFDITFFNCQCALCNDLLDPKQVTLFVACSSSHPNPGRAEWRELGELRLLCLGHTAASQIGKFGELPGIYLVHSYCNDVIATAGRRRSLFDCFRALSPVLHEKAPTTRRIWPWSSSCVVYAPILRIVLSEIAKINAANVDFVSADASNGGHGIADTTGAASLQNILKLRLDAIHIIKKALPAELSDMVLDYLPWELALALDHLSGGKQCLRRLRQDPIGRRFDQAFQVLAHEKRDFQHQNDEVKLESEMTLQYVKLGDTWYLQDLYATATQVEGGQEQVKQVKQLAFRHNHDRQPYIAIQVNSIGITHIAFKSEGKWPKWISPNIVNRQQEFFQDRSSAKSFTVVAVISDGLKLCAVDIPQPSKQRRTRAILPPEVSTGHWSLSPYGLLYVRPSIIDITKASGVYVWTPPGLGMPGFRMSNTPQPGFRQLMFGSEGVPRTVELISVPTSPEVFVHFYEGDTETLQNATREIVSNVVGVWQFDFACNVVVGNTSH